MCKKDNLSFIDKLNKVVKENPDAQIKFQVSEEIDFWEHSSLLLDSSIASILVENLTDYNGKLVDQEELEDTLIYDSDKDLIGEELALNVKVRLSKYRFEKYIIVNLMS